MAYNIGFMDTVTVSWYANLSPGVALFLNFSKRGRSCFLREASSDAELDNRIYAMGDFKKIMNVAKRMSLLLYWAQYNLNLCQDQNESAFCSHPHR